MARSHVVSEMFNLEKCRDIEIGGQRTLKVIERCIIRYIVYGFLRSEFNRRPTVQWPTRPLGGWALEAPGPGRLNFSLQLQSLDWNLN